MLRASLGETSGRVSVTKQCCVYISSPSLGVAGEHGKRHAMRPHKPQAVSDWLNTLFLGTMSAFGYFDNLA